MDFTSHRAELCHYYRDELDHIAIENRERCWAELERSIPEGLSAWEPKGLQYQRIPEFCRPRVFDNTFFYYEMGAVPIVNKNNSTGTWAYEKNRARYVQADEEIARVHRRRASFPLYSVCGEYGDELYHFVFAMDKVIGGGVRSLYENALAALESAKEPKLKAYYAAMCKGLLALKRMSALFSEAALEKLASAKDAPEEYFALINRDIAARRTTILYQNDEAFIPALVKKGVAVEDARDYSLLGCWEPVIPGATNEHCGYVNLLKILEMSVFGDFNQPDIPLKFRDFDDADSFEEVYFKG